MRGKLHSQLPAGSFTKLILNLRRVAVNRHAIGLDVLIDFTVQILHFRSPAGAGCPGFGIDDDGIRVYKSALYKRSDCQNAAGRIAPRIGNQPGARYFLPVALRQTIYRFPEKLRGRMVDAVPGLIPLRIFYAEIRGQVDHLRLRQQFFTHLRCTESLRCRSKNDIRPFCQRIQIVVQAALIHEFKKVSIYIRIRIPDITA